jgi:glycosyltransferase involved in cell wall biosynthesis
MRVLLIATHFIQYGIELANGLAEAGAEVGLVFNHQNAVQFVGQDYADTIRPEVQLLLMPGRQSRKPWTRSCLRNIRWYKKTLRSFKPEVLHLQACNDFATLWTFWFYRQPIVLTMHDITAHPGEDEKYMSSTLKWAIDHLLIPHARKHRVQFLTHGEILRQDLHRVMSLDLDSISVVHHGILGGPQILPEPTSSAVDSNTSQAPGLALFFGRMERYKGLHILADAIPLVNQQLPGIPFVIAGRGPALEKERAKLEALDNVEIRDYYISTAEVAELYQAAALNLAPYIEASQSGVVASGYAFGVPSIASKLGALPEVVIHDQNGLLVEPADPQALAAGIVRYYRDSELRNRLQAGVKTWAEGPLSWQSIAQKTLEVYRRASRKD